MNFTNTPTEFTYIPMDISGHITDGDAISSIRDGPESNLNDSVPAYTFAVNHVDLRNSDNELAAMINEADHQHARIRRRQESGRRQEPDHSLIMYTQQLDDPVAISAIMNIDENDTDEIIQMQQC